MPLTIPKENRQARALLLGLFGFLSFIIFLSSPKRTPDPPKPTNGSPSSLYHYSTDLPNSRKWRLNSMPGVKKSEPKIAKVTMMYGDNVIYTKAIHSHTLHNERWGYEMYVQRENMLGGRGFWNKPSYLLSLVIAELGKKPADRIDWFMWVDADLILINPSIPLSVFLPPPDMVPQPHFIGNKDQNGLNTGTFFMRVSPWTARMLTMALALPMYVPEMDLGNSLDQEAMAWVFNQTSPPEELVDEANEIGWDGTGGTEEQRRGFAVGGSAGEVLYQPRMWYNTYEWHHAYEGKPGSLLVHFPGLEDDRWSHMEKWLKQLADFQDNWDIPLNDTHYPSQVGEYWDTVMTAYDVLIEGGEKWLKLAQEEKAPLGQVLHDLQEGLRYEADVPERLREKIDVARSVL